MKIFVSITALFFATHSFAADAKEETVTIRMDYRPCLQALNENSTVYKNKVYAIEEKGWAFVIRNEDQTMTIIDAGGTTKLNQRMNKCNTNPNVAPLAAIAELYHKAMADQAENSNNKKVMTEKCGDLVKMAKFPQGSSMMMSGTAPFPEGTDMMTGTPVQKKKGTP